MKKLLVFIGTMFICAFAIAQTISIDWKVDGNIYAQNTCEYGGTLTVPSTPPTKYGYTFRGWGDYLKLEYIESTGTQYIDTGIQVNSSNGKTIRLEIDGNFGTSTVPANGWTLDGSAYPYYHVYVGLNRAKKIAYGNNVDVVTDYTENDLTGRHIYVIDYVEGSVSRDGVTLATFTAETSGKPAHNMLIFGWDKSREFQVAAKKYGFKIYISGTLVRNFIPAKRLSDNEVGMYDTVTKTFFTNAGTGEFIAGPVVGSL